MCKKRQRQLEASRVEFGMQKPFYFPTLCVSSLSLSPYSCLPSVPTAGKRTYTAMETTAAAAAGSDITDIWHISGLRIRFPCDESDFPFFGGSLCTNSVNAQTVCSVFAEKNRAENNSVYLAQYFCSFFSIKK